MHDHFGLSLWDFVAKKVQIDSNQRGGIDSNSKIKQISA